MCKKRNIPTTSLNHYVHVSSIIKLLQGMLILQQSSGFIFNLLRPGSYTTLTVS